MDQSISYAFSDPVAVLVLDGLAEELQEDGFGLLLHAASAQAGAEQLVRAAAVDGWVLMTVPARHPTVAAARAAGRPLVVLDEPALPGVPCPHRRPSPRTSWSAAAPRRRGSGDRTGAPATRLTPLRLERRPCAPVESLYRFRG